MQFLIAIAGTHGIVQSDDEFDDGTDDNDIPRRSSEMREYVGPITGPDATPVGSRESSRVYTMESMHQDNEDDVEEDDYLHNDFDEIDALRTCLGAD
eukprot:3672061-Rhodomonas_salina.1